MAEFDSFNCRALCRSWRRDDGPYGYARGGVSAQHAGGARFYLLHIRRYIVSGVVPPLRRAREKRPCLVSDSLTFRAPHFRGCLARETRPVGTPTGPRRAGPDRIAVRPAVNASRDRQCPRSSSDQHSAHATRHFTPYLTLRSLTSPALDAVVYTPRTAVGCPATRPRPAASLAHDDNVRMHHSN